MDASIEDFAHELQNHGFSDEVIQKFKDHQINREAFLELRECEFKEMEIKIGPRKLLLKLIREMQSFTSTEPIIEQYVVFNNGTLLPNKNYSENTAYHFNPVMINESDGINDSDTINLPNTSRPSTSRCNLTEETMKLIPSECNQVPRHAFTRYDTVENTLQNHQKGEDIITAARQSFSDQDRRALLRILVSELIQVHGYYPPVEAKIALAKAIVKEFPLLKDCRATKGYEHYFDEESRHGFIEYRLWTVRRNLHPSNKKYKKKMPQSSSTIPYSSSNVIKVEDWDEKISWMKFANPVDSNKTEIKMYLKETMGSRRDWITKEGPTINQIFTKYPRLLDYKGEMMSTEFGYLFPDKKDNFIQKFPSYYQPRILEYAKQRNYGVYKKFSQISDDDLKALLILLELLPNNNAYQRKTDQTVPNIQGETLLDKGIKRKKEDMENEELDKTDYSSKNNQVFRTVPEGTDVMEYVKEVAARSKTPIQPYIITVKGQKKDSFIILTDRFFLIPANDNAVSSFNLLFQCYFVLNIKYPPELHNFYTFIERYIYNIETKVRGIVASLHVNICSVTL